MTYKLDITLIKVNINANYVVPGNKVWFNFNCDGCTQSATTPCVPMSPVANFGTPCQFIINTADTMGSYFYLTLCYFGPSNEMIPLARARSRIGKLPLVADSPKSFELPLMSAANREQPKQIASALFTGTLAQISPSAQPPFMPSMPYSTQPQVPMPSMNYQSSGNLHSPQGSYGGAPYQQGSVPGFQQPGAMAPTPYAGAVPFHSTASQGMQQSNTYNNVPMPGQQQQYQYVQQPINMPQQGGIPQRPASVPQQQVGAPQQLGFVPPQPGGAPQQPGFVPQQPGSNSQLNQTQVGENQYYF